MSAALLERSIAHIQALECGEWEPAEVFSSAIRPREDVSVCDWVERTVVLGADQSSTPGLISLARMPYAHEILECAKDDGVDEITLLAGAQSLKTTVMQLSMLYLTSENPGPTMWIGATDDLSKEFQDERVQPVYRDSPALAKLVPDAKRAFRQGRMRLSTCTIHFAWATSASQLASRPKRFVFADEVDKYPTSLAKEANPLSLAKERQATFWSKKFYRGSTPTDHKGEIWKAYQSSSRETFRVACPHCQTYQRLVFTQVRWPVAKEGDDAIPAALIKAERLAWYECAHCKGVVKDDARAAMLNTGVWCPEGYEVIDGKVAGNPPRFKHRGFWWNVLYSPFRSWSDAAAEYLESTHDFDRRQNFINSWLAEPHSPDAKEMRTSRMDEVKGTYRRGEVPVSPVVLTCGVDVQQNHCWYVVRAWDQEMNSWLIDWGRVDDHGRQNSDLDELKFYVLNRQFKDQQGLRVEMVGGFIDTRYRGADVFRWLRTCPPWMRGSQGDTRGGSSGRMMREIEWDPKRRGKSTRFGMSYHLLQTGSFKDWITRKFEAEGEWHVPMDVDTVYTKQFFSEHKIAAQGVRGKRGDLVWEKRPNVIDNHLWDCEVYALAAAHLAGVGRGKLPRAPGTKKGEDWLKQFNEKRAKRSAR